MRRKAARGRTTARNTVQLAADAHNPAAHSRTATIAPIARPAHDRRRDIMRTGAEIQERHGAQHRRDAAQQLARSGTHLSAARRVQWRSSIGHHALCMASGRAPCPASAQASRALVLAAMMMGRRHARRRRGRCDFDFSSFRL
ncbi:hypothetical protein F511_27529 [Dorcoceras hygrometricum]|uniref:Uncharacterized protein n=1 Tax=Dorcoceras hygrometricum TaxID=472368 RepID=A0A2Z7DCH3_9LAMI|nr:hypothetical protein F511_27529 [Dorcoceras hygrometricum]